MRGWAESAERSPSQSSLLGETPELTAAALESESTLSTSASMLAALRLAARALEALEGRREESSPLLSAPSPSSISRLILTLTAASSLGAQLLVLRVDLDADDLPAALLERHHGDELRGGEQSRGGHDRGRLGLDLGVDLLGALPRRDEPRALALAPHSLEVARRSTPWAPPACPPRARRGKIRPGGSACTAAATNDRGRGEKENEQPQCEPLTRLAASHLRTAPVRCAALRCAALRRAVLPVCC